MSSPEHVQIRDFSDREIIAIMADLNSGPLEFVTTTEMARRIFGLGSDEVNTEQLRYAEKCVTARMTWMRRYGLVVKGEEKGHWHISADGYRLRFAKLPRAVSNALSHSPDASMLELTHEVAERMLQADEVVSRAMRREFQFQTNRRKRRG
jgi:hypothetical protein